jgi:hypothetical protein
MGMIRKRAEQANGSTKNNTSNGGSFLPTSDASATPPKRRSRSALRQQRIMRFCALLLSILGLFFLHSHSSLAAQDVRSTLLRASKFERFLLQAPTCPTQTQLDPSQVTLTLVTQCTQDRLWMMEYHCQRWGPNPISLVVYTHASVFDIQTELKSFGCHVDLITVQVVPADHKEDYPVNMLRNKALSAVRTTHGKLTVLYYCVLALSIGVGVVVLSIEYCCCCSIPP